MDGRLYHLAPVSLVVGRATNSRASCTTGVTPLSRYYRPIRHPLVVSRFPGVSGYTAYPASALSSRDEEGFSSSALDSRPRAVANHPAGAARRVNGFAAECSLHPTGAGSASGATHFRGRLAFTLVTAQELDLTLLARSSRGLPSKLRGLPDSCPGRFVSCTILTGFCNVAAFGSPSAGI